MIIRRHSGKPLRDHLVPEGLFSSPFRAFFRNGIFCRCPVPCNFSTRGAYTDGNAKAKEDTEMNRTSCGDLDDLIFQDEWTISER